MLIIKKEKELLKIHDLLKLSQLAEIKLSLDHKNFIEKLNKFYLRSRYPDIFYKPLPNPNKNEIQDILNKTKKLFLWLKKQ